MCNALQKMYDNLFSKLDKLSIMELRILIGVAMTMCILKCKYPKPHVTYCDKYNKFKILLIKRRQKQ